MGSHREQQHARVRKMQSAIDQLAVEQGQSVPCNYPGAAVNALLIDLAPLRIDILPDRFRCFAAKSRTMIGESLLERKGWNHYDVKLFGERRLSFNVNSNGEILIYQFKPGRWMKDYFDIDPAGDHTSILPGLFQDDNDPAWVAFRNSGLYKWPPEFPEASE